jgi:hypothetical protein
MENYSQKTIKSLYKKKTRFTMTDIDLIAEYFKKLHKTSTQIRPDLVLKKHLDFMTSLPLQNQPILFQYLYMRELPSAIYVCILKKEGPDGNSVYKSGEVSLLE